MMIMSNAKIILPKPTLYSNFRPKAGVLTVARQCVAPSLH